MNTLDQLKNRRTYKVIGDTTHPSEPSNIKTDALDEIILAAGNAPFHYACDRIHMQTMQSPVPWRCHKLDTTGCQYLMQNLIDRGDTTKVPNMLAAAQYLLQVTWLPDSGTILGDATSKEEPVFAGTLRNMEHIAAGSAFIQSILLGAEQAGFKTYWSSGGPLRGEDVFSALGIPAIELLLGSVFLFPDEPKSAEIKQGNLASKRGQLSDWSRWCEINKV